MSRSQHKSVLDRALFSVVTRDWEDHHITNYFVSLQNHDLIVAGVTSEPLQRIDTKAAGLLTHVSMMIAGLGLIAPLVASSHLEVGVVVVEIAAYMLIALGCLRCLSIFQSKELFRPSENLQELVSYELILRRELYGWCNRLAIILTIVVFLLLPVLFLWTPEA
jgi:hypothetical protein